MTTTETEALIAQARADERTLCAKFIHAHRIVRPKDSSDDGWNDAVYTIASSLRSAIPRPTYTDQSAPCPTCGFHIVERKAAPLVFDDEATPQPQDEKDRK